MTLVLTGHYDQAIDYLTHNHFHIREGGGEIHGVYVNAHLLRGITRLAADQPSRALTDFLAASEYPENLSVGRPQKDARAAQVAYYTARAYQALGNVEKSKVYDEQAARQKGTGAWPEARFYQARAMVKLGRVEQAKATFQELVETGNARIEGDEGADFFAKFGEQQARRAGLASAHYLLGLGYLGSGRTEAAKAQFERAAQLNASHVWARAYLGRSIP